MNELTGEWILNHAFTLLMVVARVAPVFAMLPGLGEATVPAVTKAGLALTLTILLIPLIEGSLPSRPTHELSLALMIATEIGNGLWFGWLARLLTSSLPMAGQFIASFTGLANVLQPSPEMGSQTTAVARLYEIAVPTLILSSGLYTEPLRALIGFYRLVPPGTAVFSSDSAILTVSMVAESFDLALRLAAPFVLAAVAWNVAIGLLARLVPRLQIFFVAAPGQIGVGLLLLAAVAAPLTGAWMSAMHVGFGDLPGIR